MYQPAPAGKAAAMMTLFAAKRALLLPFAGRYDAVFVQREAALVGPPIAEWLLSRRIPVVFDMDDALWLEPPLTPSSLRAKYPALGNLVRAPAKANPMLQLCAHATVATSYLAAYAKQRRGDRDVTTIPTVVSHRAWTPAPGRLDGMMSDVPVVGWIGTHSTAVYLDLARPALRRLAAEGHRFVLRIRGAMGKIDETAFPVEQLPWRLDTEAEDFASIDIGLAPLFEDAWSEGKGGFKQLQYMATGVPMVSSLVGGARDFVRHEENALVASTEEDWYQHLRRLLTDRETRRRLSRAGRDLAVREYSTEAQAPRLVAVMRRVLGESA